MAVRGEAGDRLAAVQRSGAAGRNRRTVRVEGPPGWMAASRRGLWLTDGRRLRFVAARSNRVVTVPGIPPETAPLAVGLGAVWIPSGRQVVRLDERTRGRLASVQLARPALLVGTGSGHVWIVVRAGDSAARLLRFDPLERLWTAPVRFAPGRARSSPSAVGSGSARADSIRGSCG